MSSRRAEFTRTRAVRSRSPEWPAQACPQLPASCSQPSRITLDSSDAEAGYLLQLNANATALNFATYLTGTDSAVGPAVDAGGDFYVAGFTSELNLPVSANAYQKTIVPG